MQLVLTLLAHSCWTNEMQQLIVFCLFGSFTGCTLITHSARLLLLTGNDFKLFYELLTELVNIHIYAHFLSIKEGS